MPGNGRDSRFILAAMTALGALFSPPQCPAHPMGNFSISHYTDIRVEQGSIELRYLIDMAEIPTFQEFQQNQLVTQTQDGRVQAYLSSQTENFRKSLLLTLNGQPLSLETVSREILFSQGAGNLPTMKFGVVYRAQVTVECALTPCELHYLDDNFSGRLGWKEVVASPGPAVAFKNSSVPTQDRSHQLSNYPTDLINSPPEDLGARIVYSVATSFSPPSSNTAGGNTGSPPATRPAPGSKYARKTNPAPAAAPSSSTVGSLSASLQLKRNQQASPRSPFTQLVATKQLSLTAVLLAAAIACGLGALHALEPGHGKTIVAAYLVGSRGSARQALLLGLMVTIFHTVGVYLLGAATLYAQRYILPERIYPFLAVLSGILVAGTGCYLLLQRFAGDEFRHTHRYELSLPRESSKERTRRKPGKVSLRQLLVLGITGGIVPCPAALVVLLSATALHRAAFGLYLIAAFSIGLAVALIAMGLAAVYSGSLLSRLSGPLIERWLPMASSATIIVMGLGVAIRGLISAGIVQLPRWS